METSCSQGAPWFERKSLLCMGVVTPGTSPEEQTLEGQTHPHLTYCSMSSTQRPENDKSWMVTAPPNQELLQSKRRYTLNSHPNSMQEPALPTHASQVLSSKHSLKSAGGLRQAARHGLGSQPRSQDLPHVWEGWAPPELETCLPAPSTSSSTGARCRQRH